MPIIKEDVGDMIQNVAQLFLAKGLEEEIRIALGKNYMERESKNATTKCPGEKLLTYDEWKVLPPGLSTKKVAIFVYIEMGWQQHGFCSLSGHAFMIGARSKKSSM
eukprot:9521238-Ditylum_brightwellii.AAC.2